MRMQLRRMLQVTVAALALGASGFAVAADQGITGRLASKAREQAQQQNSAARESRPAQRSESRPAQRESRPTQRNESRPAQRNESRSVQRNESRPAQRNESRSAQRNESRPAQASAPPAASGRNTQRVERPAARTPSPAQSERREAAADSSRAARPSAPASQPAAAARQRDSSNVAATDRGLTGTLIQREYQTRNPREDRSDRDRDRNDRNDRNWGRDTNANRDRNDRRNVWRQRDRDYRSRRPVQVIHRLPVGYRDYAWNGTHYYYHNGYWYRPHGTSYISVSVPYGFFVGTLPGSYTSVWVGGTRYYYSDYHYYTYEPVRRGYVVVRSPYEDEEEYVDERLDQDLYIYPAQGQSEQQQADDRYECHRWAVHESGYDPIDDEYDPDLRDNYLRAMTACLVGRGYTVR